MPQEYGYMANAEESAKMFTCLICDTENVSWNWTDYSGEAYCMECGTPYQLKGDILKEGETYPRINIKKEWLSILKQYWNETHRGNGLGTFMLWRDYPDQKENKNDFVRWYKNLDNKEKTQED